MKCYRRLDVETGELKEERFGIRVFLTSNRIFMLDAEVHHVPMLEEIKDNLGLFRVRELEINHVVMDEVWYYPIPLVSLKGISLDVHYQTVAKGSIKQKRPLMLCFGLAALAVAMTVHANTIVPVIALLGQMLVSMMDEGQGGDVNASNTSGVNSFGRTPEEEQQHEAYKAFFIAVAIALSIPVTFFKIDAYSRSNFTATMAQRRHITIGRSVFRCRQS